MRPSDGDQVILNGSISMYVAKGSYQFQVDSIEYAGEGFLLKNFEELKKRLQSDGFFDKETKLNLPHLPRHIAVISSANGAVIQDIKNVINRRAPLIQISLIPALVQGDSSEDSLLNAVSLVKKLNDLKSVDAVIFATHSDQALKLLDRPTELESEILQAFPYQKNDVMLHTDSSVLPTRKLAWASWNYQLDRDPSAPVVLTYNMNILQSIKANETFCVTLNDFNSVDQNKVIKKITYHHPLFTVDSV